MISRILLGVDDSPGGWPPPAWPSTSRPAWVPAAGRQRRRGRQARRDDGGVSGAGGLRERRGDAAAAVLEHIGELARRAGVQVETCRLRAPRPGASSPRPRHGTPT